ncbi:MAG: TonB-dependent receptor, partial [Parahaliea sp.]
INLSTRNPTPEPEGYVELTQELENTKETSIDAAYGRFVTDTFGVRLAARYTSSNEWVDNTYNGQDMGGAHTEMVTRLSLLWEPSDRLNLAGKLQYSDLTLNERPSVLSKCSPALQAILAGGDDCRFDDDATISARDPEGGWGGTEMQAMSAGLTVNWDMSDELTLTSVTGFTKHIEDLYLDSDYSLAEILDSRRDENYQSISQELRIASSTGGKFDYMAGVYVSQDELQFDAGLSYNGLFTRAADAYQETDSRAVFGQLTWHATGTLALTLGARYSEDEKDVEHTTWCTQYKSKVPTGAAACFGPTFQLTDSLDDENFSPSLTLEWTVSGDIMAYAKYSEGYKSGGFDLQSLTGNLDTYQFEPEEAKSYEAGVKSTLLGGGMTLNLALFRSEYTNLQVSTFDGNVGFNVGNAAEAVSQGLDVDLNWAITDSLSTSLSLAFLDAFYDEFDTAQCSYPQTLVWAGPGACVADMSDEETQYAPDWSGHWNLSWETSVTDTLLLNLSGDLNFTDAFFAISDNDPEFRQGSYAKLDTRISLQPHEGHWELALVARNLTDKRTFHIGNDVPLFPGSYFKDREVGRTVSLQARYRF